MDDMRNFDFEGYAAQAPLRRLRQAAAAYFLTAIELYLKIEGRVSVWNDLRFGDSANVVCCLNRAIEHLLKLRLLKIDPLLLYPLPKNVEDYCRVRQIATKNSEGAVRRIKEREALSHTISFKEALTRVDLTYPPGDYNFKCFWEIYSLRNSLEHHWDRNEVLLRKVVGRTSSLVIPQITQFIERILGEDPKHYLPNDLISEVQALDRAIERGHSLRQQQRFEEHARIYRENPDIAKRRLQLPAAYRDLAEVETEVECPVCREKMTALWGWEADYDVDDGVGCISGGFSDAKALHCEQCGYFVEGEDVETYLPDGLDIEMEPDCDDDY